MVVMSRRRVFLLALVAFLLIPAAALAGTLFSDVTDGTTHFKGIEFMKSSGVTIGCGDGTTYCPKDPVLREQMATFMYRLSGNDPATPPSVNADKLDGKDSTAFLGKTEKAADSDLLDGLDSTAFLGKTEKAADSDKLDGFSSENLVPFFIFKVDGSITDNVASGDRVCITDPFTPTSNMLAIFDAGASAEADTTDGSLWVRIGVTTDAGATWSNVSGRVSPEDFVTATSDGAVSYMDDMDLVAGTTYQFAVRPNGGTYDAVRCQLRVTLSPQIGAGVLGADLAGAGAVDNG
jgi:hypothetical protein